MSILFTFPQNIPLNKTAHSPVPRHPRSHPLPIASCRKGPEARTLAGRCPGCRRGREATTPGVSARPVPPTTLPRCSLVTPAKNSVILQKCHKQTKPLTSRLGHLATRISLNFVSICSNTKLISIIKKKKKKM